MNDQLRHTIEAYLANQLSEEETVAFEKQMENDPALKHEVDLARQINLHLQDGGSDMEVPNNTYTQNLKEFLGSEEANRLEATLRKVQDEYRADSQKPSKFKIYRIAAILTVLLLTVVGVLFLSPDSNAKLYASYYAEGDLPSLISRGSDVNTLELGATSFQEGDFDTALTYFEDYLEKADSIDPAVYVYTGMAQAELGNYEKAISEMDRLINSDALDRSKGLWFKAMVYLKMDDSANARQILEEIVKSPSNFNSNKAKELLKKL